MTTHSPWFSRGSPTAPLWWIDACLAELTRKATSDVSSKIMVGPRMYGFDTGSGEVTGQQVVEILKNHRPRIVLDAEVQEHYADLGKNRTMYFPTPWSVAKRIEYAAQNGYGIHIWEMGLTMPYMVGLLGSTTEEVAKGRR